MDRSTLEVPADGGCRCGAIRFRLSSEPLLTSACHCRGCQRMSASAFSLTVSMPEQGFTILEGEPVIGGLHGPDVHHFHCDRCKSWLFTRPEPPMGFVNVRPTMLDHPFWFEPFVEVSTADKLPWATTPARHSFAHQPAPAEFEPLVAEFRSRGRG